MINKSITELSACLCRREFSAEELAKVYIERISEQDGQINAFITVTAERALAAAKEVDRKRLSGEELPMLAGIPFALKDNICVSGVKTTCGSKMLADFVSPYTATVAARLESRGAVLLGKLNMDEFAMGSASDTSAYGAVKNPLDISRTAGGSSGGSAAAVAARMCAFSLGSDTGGSVRQPSAFCGLVGIKSTYGAISRYGLISFASSLEQIGPLTHGVADNAIVFSSICGADRLDATTLSDFCLSPEIVSDVSKLRIGFCMGGEGVSPEINNAILRARQALFDRGAEVRDVALPSVSAAVAAYYIISASEASSNLGRYDGIRYGYRPDSATDIDSLFAKSRSEAFGNEVKRRIMLGSFCLNSEGRDAYYKKALGARTKISGELEGLFEDVDAIIAPVAPTVAYKFEQKKKRPVDVYADDAYSVIANLCGIPSLCVPCGEGSEGMPVGIQIMGKKRSEATLYRIGLALEEYGEGGK